MSFPSFPWHAAPDARRKAAAGAVIVAAVLAGIYTVASATATSLAGGFSATQSETHSRNVAFEAETMRIAAERAAASERCDAGTRRQKFVCRAAARMEVERTLLRSAYGSNARP